MARPEDTLTKAGARSLVVQIREYWALRGHSVRVEAVPIQDWPDMWGVRSNLVNGVPPGTVC
ncbi:hypothetical protein ACQR1I_36275 [Bradyrhizobium sp. HKCCYLS2038]|uniref:hypothetical protein n=1 Tax=Bradyrhizobium sp. HKCCYLS2038 TaxID=3420764 RepID=UPI003EBDC316